MTHRVTLTVPAVRNTEVCDLVEHLIRAADMALPGGQTEQFELLVEPTWGDDD